MNIGLNINEETRINIGESMDSLVSTLKLKGIEHKILNKVENEESEDKNIYIEDYGLELSLRDNKIVYMKSYNSSNNIVFKVNEDTKIRDIVRYITTGIESLMGVSSGYISIEKIDLDRYIALVNIGLDDSSNIRVSIVKKNNNNVCVNTLRLLS